MRKMTILGARLTAILMATVLIAAWILFINAEVSAESGLALSLEDPSKTEYTEGESVFIKASGNAEGAWVGLYRKDENNNPDAGGVNSLRWYWVGNHNGIAEDITADEFKDVRKDKITAGEYKVILYGDDGYTNVVDTIYFTVVKGSTPVSPDASDELSLTLVDAKESYIEDESIYVKATGTASGAWVGLYARGAVKDPANGGELSYRWYSVPDYNGVRVDLTSGSFDANNRGSAGPGEYEIILFGDGGYENVIKTIDITITENPEKEPDQPSDDLSLTLLSTAESYKIGEPVYIRVTGTAEGAWVGLYKEGDTKNPEAGGVPSLRWFYTADHNGAKVNIMSTQWQGDRKDSITEGNYEIVLFGDGGYSNIVDSAAIRVEGVVDIDPSDYSLETDKTDYLYGDPIKVRASGTGIDNSAWVGLYSADTASYGSNYLYYYYVKDYEGVFTTIQGRNKGLSADSRVGNGSYKLVIFADSGYDLPVESLNVYITVTRTAVSLHRIREPGCMTYGLEYAVYEDGTSEYREVPTLGGHIWGEPQHIEGTDTHRYTCERNEAHVKTETCTPSASKLIRKATLGSDGIRQHTCSVCGGVYTEAIPALRSAPALKTTLYTYNGSKRTPALKNIYSSDGKKISSGNYTVTRPAKSTAVGKYTVTVRFKGDYTGTYKLNYKIRPAATSITKLTNTGGSRRFTVRWKKVSKQVTGYQIAYSTSSKFSNVKYCRVSKSSAGRTIRKLKAGKKYYVKVRTYKTVNGSNIYSAWSVVKKVTTKK